MATYFLISTWSVLNISVSF